MPTADVASAGTIYLTPWLHNAISVYSGGAWKTMNSAEISLAVTGRTADLPFDIFCYDNSGTLTLEFLDWSDATTRATALTRQDGAWVKNGDATRLYLGSCRARAATNFAWVTVADGVSATAKLDLWNFYNRVPTRGIVYDSTDSHTYTTATVRQWRAVATYQIEIMVGLQGEYVEGFTNVYAYNSSTGITSTGLGYDVTNAFTMSGYQSTGNHYGSSPTEHTSVLLHQPEIGRHYYSWNQWSTAVGTSTWYGDAGGTTLQSNAMIIWRC